MILITRKIINLNLNILHNPKKTQTLILEAEHAMVITHAVQDDQLWTHQQTDQVKIIICDNLVYELFSYTFYKTQIG
jgi:hypothetical protein